MALQGLAKYCGKLTRPGLSQIEYLPINWINESSYERIIGSGWIWKGNIEVSTGSWLSAPVLPRSRRWNEQQLSGKQGRRYRQTISAISPDLIPLVQGEFDEMANHLYLLRLTDRSQQKWILGSLESPFEFFANGDIGGNGQTKNHQIRFVALSKFRGYGLP